WCWSTSAVSRQRARTKAPRSWRRTGLLLRRLLLLLLHLLLEHLLLKQCRAAADDLLDANLESKRAILGEARGRRAVPERQLLRHREAVLTAFLHLRHRLGEAGEDLIHGEGLSSTVGFAAVEDSAVVGGEDVVHQRRVVARDRVALAGMDRAELQSAGGNGRPKRSGADPGEADSGCNNQEKPDPKRERTPAMIGSMGGFGGGHLFVRLGFNARSRARRACARACGHGGSPRHARGRAFPTASHSDGAASSRGRRPRAAASSSARAAPARHYCRER